MPVTAHPLVLYAILVVDFWGHVVPVAVAALSLRRTVLSYGFNRWLYGYVAHYAVLAFVLLAILSPEDGPPYLLAQLGAWATLPLWLCIRELTPQTRTERPQTPNPTAPAA